jgi:hypothetical protein
MKLLTLRTSSATLTSSTTMTTCLRMLMLCGLFAQTDASASMQESNNALKNFLRDAATLDASHQTGNHVPTMDQHMFVSLMKQASSTDSFGYATRNMIMSEFQSVIELLRKQGQSPAMSQFMSSMSNMFESNLKPSIMQSFNNLSASVNSSYTSGYQQCDAQYLAAQGLNGPVVNSTQIFLSRIPGVMSCRSTESTLQTAANQNASTTAALASINNSACTAFSNLDLSGPSNCPNVAGENASSYALRMASFFEQQNNNWTQIRRACIQASANLAVQLLSSQNSSQVWSAQKSTCDNLQDQMDAASCNVYSTSQSVCSDYSSCYNQFTTTFRVQQQGFNDRASGLQSQWSLVLQLQCFMNSLQSVNISTSNCTNQTLLNGIANRTLVLYYPPIPKTPLTCQSASGYAGTTSYEQNLYNNLPGNAKAKFCTASCCPTTTTTTTSTTRASGMPAGIFAWYDASNNPSTNGWTDLSGNGYHLTPVGSAAGATSMNGRVALDFNSGRQYTRSSVPLSSYDITIMMVVTTAGSFTSWANYMHHGNRDSDWAMEHNAWGNNFLHFQSLNDNVQNQVQVSPNTQYIFVGKYANRVRSLTVYSISGAQVAASTTTDASYSLGLGSKTIYVGTSDVGERSNAVFGEILYYQRALSDSEVASLVQQLSTKWSRQATIAIATRFLSDSAILTSSDQQILFRLGLNSQKQWRLCYSKRRDGGDAFKFHSLCDGKGPSITVMSLPNGRKLGGHTPYSWASNDAYIGQGPSDSWLFSIFAGDNAGQGCKYPITTHNALSIHGGRSYGPTFGAGHDLNVRTDMNAASCGYNTYRFAEPGAPRCPSNSCSGDSITIVDLEVYVNP